MHDCLANTALDVYLGGWGNTEKTRRNLPNASVSHSLVSITCIRLLWMCMEGVLVSLRRCLAETNTAEELRGVVLRPWCAGVSGLWLWGWLLWRRVDRPTVYTQLCGLGLPIRTLCAE